MFLLHGTAGAASPTFFGYDLPRLHAALNDFPPALLLTAVFLEILFLWTRRESLRAASYWTLVLGGLSTAVTVVSGLLAANTIMDSGETRALMDEHEDAAYWTLGFFVVLTAWRVLRERVMSRRERRWALVFSLVAVATLIRTAQHGGSLVFDHGAGLSEDTMRDAVEAQEAMRAAEKAEGSEAGMTHDQGGMAMDSTGGHQHADSAAGAEHEHKH
jgi:uncharacterized membrane protein